MANKAEEKGTEIMAGSPINDPAAKKEYGRTTKELYPGPLEERPHRTANGGNRQQLPDPTGTAAASATPKEHNRQTSVPDAANTKSSKPLPRRRHGRTGQR
jgi:hypothetical protein